MEPVIRLTLDVIAFYLAFNYVNLLRIVGVFLAHYLQSVTRNLALGAELVYQRMLPQQGGQAAFTSLAARYTGINNI